MMNLLQTIFITNDAEVAKYCEDSGVKIIMIDCEYIGKNERQKGMNTVKSNHKISDILAIKTSISKIKIMVRINPFYIETRDEIEKAIKYGADYIMLPMFKTKTEIVEVLDIIDNRIKLIPLLETKEAFDNLDEILSVKGVYMYHIGLNDLHLSFNFKFMFESISSGIVEIITNKMKEKNIRFGIGGISRLGTGLLKSNLILSEYYRLGSEMVILSRSFYNYAKNYNEIVSNIDLKKEVTKINDFYSLINRFSLEQIEKNKVKFNLEVKKIIMEQKNV